LKEAGLDFQYASQSFTVAEAFTYLGESFEPDKRKGDGMFAKSKKLQAITYKPDFVSEDGTWIIETKGRPNESFPLRWKLFKKYLFDNNLKYDLYMPKNHKQVNECIKMILNKG